MKRNTKKGLTENGWDVMCNVDKVVIDVVNKRGFLYLPELNAPDMESTINCFTSVDPECEIIYTYVAGRPDTVYLKDEDKWRSAYPDWAERVGVPL